MKSVFELKTDDQGIGRLYFDLPGEKVNLFNEQVFDEFEKTLEHLETLKLKALLLFSGKKDIFIAGADVYAFRKIDTLEAGWQAARRGQLLFERWHQLPFPTIAVINGACMGGGTELSLACTCRLVSGHPKTRIGLPEVRLGILPGWGGTQRLPKLVGLPAALKMILSGKPVDAGQALKIGLVQKIISSQNLEQAALQFAQQIVQQKELCQSKKLSVWERFPLTRQIIFQQARKRVLKETHGFYPAPLKAIEVIEQTWNLPIEKGLGIEAKALAELIVTPQSKNLVDLFIWSEELKKEVRQNFTQPERPLLEKVVFVGADQHQSALYLSLLRKRATLVFLEEDEQVFQNTRKSIERKSRKLVIRKKISVKEHETFLQNVRLENNTKGLKKNPLIVLNQVPASKWQQIKAQIQLVSLLALTDKKGINLVKKGLPVFNYFYWQEQNFAVEISATQEANPDALKSAVHFFLNLKLVPVISSKNPFGIVQWLLTILFSEANQLLKENLSMAQIDGAMEAFGWQMGPFKLLRKIGLSTFAGILQSMLKYDEQKEILVILNGQELLRSLTNGKLGREESSKKNPREVNQYIQQRLNLILVNWAAHFLARGEINSPQALNLLSVSALGFPPFHGGLLRWAKVQDFNQMVDQLQNFEKEIGLRYRPTEGLKKLLGGKKTF